MTNAFDDSAYPVLRATTAALNRPRALEVLDDAFKTVALALANGQIPNVAFKESRQVVARAFERAWMQHVQDPFFNAGKYRDQPSLINGLNDRIGVPEFHRSDALLRRIDASGMDGPVIEAMREVAQEAADLQARFNELKPFIVMGNRPLTDEERLARVQSENPNKTIRTCACCFRGIAVTPSLLMAHHGYTRPGEGIQTSSCMGVSYMPLEVSAQGLQALIGALKAQRQHIEQEMLAAHTLTSLHRRTRAHGGRIVLEVAGPSDKDWPSLFARHVATLESKKSALDEGIDALTQRLSSWAQKETRQQLLDTRLGLGEDGVGEVVEDAAEAAPAP